MDEVRRWIRMRNSLKMTWAACWAASGTLPRSAGRDQSGHGPAPPGMRRKALGGVAAAVVVGMIVTTLALHAARTVPHLPPVSQAAALPEQPLPPRPGGNEMPTLSFVSVAMPALAASQEFKFQTGQSAFPPP